MLFCTQYLLSYRKQHRCTLKRQMSFVPVLGVFQKCLLAKAFLESRQFRCRAAHGRQRRQRLSEKCFQWIFYHEANMLACKGILRSRQFRCRAAHGAATPFKDFQRKAFSGYFTMKQICLLARAFCEAVNSAVVLRTGGNAVKDFQRKAFSGYYNISTCRKSACYNSVSINTSNQKSASGLLFRYCVYYNISEKLRLIISAFKHNFYALSCLTLAAE